VPLVACIPGLCQRHTIGICLSNGFLFQEWQFVDIFQRADIGWLDACFIIEGTIKLVLVVGALHYCLQAL
jgi:hypothetical protein